MKSEGQVANAIASQLAGGLQDLIEKCQSNGSVRGESEKLSIPFIEC